jgi:hypothetical protein
MEQGTGVVTWDREALLDIDVVICALACVCLNGQSSITRRLEHS